MGEHHVRLQLTSGGVEHVATIIVSVVISSSTPKLNIIDAGDVGASHTLFNDGTQAQENSSRLAGILATYYDSEHGLELYFPGGHYAFRDSGSWKSAPASNRYAIRLPNDSKMVFSGDPRDRAILAYNNTKHFAGDSRDAMFYRNKSPGYLMVKDLIIQWAGDDSIDAFDRQEFLAEPDSRVGLHVTIDDSPFVLARSFSFRRILETWGEMIAFAQRLPWSPEASYVRVADIHRNWSDPVAITAGHVHQDGDASAADGYDDGSADGEGEMDTEMVLFATLTKSAPTHATAMRISLRPMFQTYPSRSGAIAETPGSTMRSSG